MGKKLRKTSILTHFHSFYSNYDLLRVHNSFFLKNYSLLEFIEIVKIKSLIYTEIEGVLEI